MGGQGERSSGSGLMALPRTGTAVRRTSSAQGEVEAQWAVPCQHLEVAVLVQ